MSDATEKPDRYAHLRAIVERAITTAGNNDLGWEIEETKNVNEYWSSGPGTSGDAKPTKVIAALRDMTLTIKFKSRYGGH